MFVGNENKFNARKIEVKINMKIVVFWMREEHIKKE